MARFGFVGPSYTSLSPIFNDDRTLNWYPERDEAGDSKSAIAVYPSPGLKRFCDSIADTNVRGEITLNGRAFAIVGSGFYEISAAGVPTKLGSVANDGKPASLAASSTQIVIASGLLGYCFTLSTNAFVAVDPAALVNPRIVLCIDDFFLAIRANSNQFQYSIALDGTSWPGDNVSGVEVFSDNIVGAVADHRQLLLWSNKQGVAYYDSGNTFTFDVVPGGFFDDGLAAAFAVNNIDNTSFYLSTDARGNIVAKRLQGYLPVRISNHAVEQAWRSCGDVSDAISYSWGWNGHSFWQINFPSANSGRGATWVYDVATSMWHERCFFQNGREYAHRSQCHMYVFNKHLVGDPLSGIIYEMDDTFLTDDGNAIKRLRRAPHIANEQQRIPHNSLQIDLETGLGPNIPLENPDGSSRGPLVTLRWSDDGGKTWSNGLDLDCGQIGQYNTRVIAYRLGTARDRVYEMSTTDPWSPRIIDAYLDATGYGRVPTPRLQDRLRQQA